MKRAELTEKNNQNWYRGQAFSCNDCDLEFREIAQGFLCGDVTEHGTLSDVQKALIRLVALATCQTLKPLEGYTLSALDVGATPEQIKETLYQCAPYIGLEKVQCALDEVNLAFQSASITYPLAKQSTVSEETRFEKGLAVPAGDFWGGEYQYHESQRPGGTEAYPGLSLRLLFWGLLHQRNAGFENARVDYFLRHLLSRWV